MSASMEVEILKKFGRMMLIWGSRVYILIYWKKKKKTFPDEFVVGIVNTWNNNIGFDRSLK